MQDDDSRWSSVEGGSSYVLDEEEVDNTSEANDENVSGFEDFSVEGP